MQVTRDNRSSRIIEVTGDPLRCLKTITEANTSARLPSNLRVIGIDGRSAHTRAGFAALLRREKRDASRIPPSVSHIIVVIDDPDYSDPWTIKKVHRWAMSIHRRIQRTPGVDADVTVLLVNRDVDPQLIFERIEELAQRRPGVNPAAVHTMDEIRAHTIAQASTNDFI